MNGSAMVNGPPSAVAQRARLAQSRRAAQMVADLPEVLGVVGMGPLLREAAVESFHIQARELLEFLLLRVHPTGAVCATDISPTWTPSLGSNQALRLQDYHDTAQQYLSRLWSQSARTETATAGEVAAESAQFQTIADRVLAVWDQYTHEFDRRDRLAR
ncbi:hypothetical protein ACTD5D_22725 [Nocardia takedensis]|uniref:hypothetical protein n=1 Tax=Nocardia takedensis TaxID=259390 RepID=UPI003F75B69C